MLRVFFHLPLTLCFAAVCLAGASLDSPAPSREEQVAILAAAQKSALEFTRTLPDFICTQVTRRWVGQREDTFVMATGDPPSNIGTMNLDEKWKLKDTLTVQLTFFGQKEKYKLLLVNGKRTNKAYESVEGATNYGDFGSVLGMLFQPSSRARFTWRGRVILNGQTAMVFVFDVPQTSSQWQIAYGHQQIATGFEGLVFIDPEGKRVLRLEANADGIPKNFPIKKSRVELDYGFQTIGGERFLLPLKAVEWTDTRNASTKNEVEFHRYRKFTTDSKIDFGTPAPLPETQIKRPN